MVSHDNCMWTSGVCSVLYGLGEVRIVYVIRGNSASIN